MEPSSSGTKDNDDETRDLISLLECFESLFTLEEIADTYCIAEQDVIKAGDMLYQLQDRRGNSESHAQNGQKNYFQRKETMHEEKLEYLTRHENNCMKPKKLSASFGTVSGAVVAKYGRYSAPTNELNEKTKPPKLNIEKPLVDEIDQESTSKFVPRNDTFSDKDTQDFLYSMLGDGFQLSMDIIQEVLGNCGYNNKESINQLLALSAKMLDKGKEEDCNVAGKMETSLSGEGYPNSSSTIRMDNKNANLPREVLQSLFCFPEKSEEEPKLKRTDLELNRTEVVGQDAVAEPLDDLTFFSSPHYTSKTKLVNDDDEVNNYQILRKAAKKHWDAMKEYYEAAIDAFTKGDKERANYLLEQGKYHTEMAREVNEKSAKEIVEPREDKEEVILLDLKAHEAKEALDILKIHLRSLANIPSFSCLKLILGPGTEDSKNRRKRRMVIKLLEKESIEWSEDIDTPGTICIQLDEVDPEELSFRKSHI